MASDAGAAITTAWNGQVPMRRGFASKPAGQVKEEYIKLLVKGKQAMHKTKMLVSLVNPASIVVTSLGSWHALSRVYFLSCWGLAPFMPL